MKNSSITPAQFKQQLLDLGSIISNGLAYFATWRTLMVDNDYAAQALNRYRGFFLTARDAMLWMSLMQFAKIFDRDRRAVSIRNLLIEARKNPKVLVPYAKATELDDIEARMATNEAVLEQLKAVRDQRIAHHDAIKASDRHLLYGDVSRLVEDIKYIYNELNQLHDGIIWNFDHLTKSAEQHTSEVIRIMCEESDRAKKSIEDIESKL